MRTYIQPLRKIFKTNHHAKKDSNIMCLHSQIMDCLHPPPITSHLREVSGRPEEVTGSVTENGEELGEETFEEEAAVLFDDGIIQLPRYHITFHTQL